MAIIMGNTEIRKSLNVLTVIPYRAVIKCCARMYPGMNIYVMGHYHS